MKIQDSFNRDSELEPEAMNYDYKKLDRTAIKYNKSKILLKKFWIGDKSKGWIAYFSFFFNIFQLVYYCLLIQPIISQKLTSFINYLHLVVEILCIYFQIKTCFTEPGIVFPSPIYESHEQEPDKESIIKAEEKSAHTEFTHLFRDQNFDLDIDFYKTRFCQTCKSQRPPLASHCSECGFCIKGFDHHCIIIANCIGSRNLKSFYFFIILGFFSTIIRFFSCLYLIKFIFEERSDIFQGVPLANEHLIYLIFLLAAFIIFKYLNSMIYMIFCYIAFMIIMLHFCCMIYNSKYPAMMNLLTPLFQMLMSIFLILWSYDMGKGMTQRILNGVTFKEYVSIDQKAKKEDKKRLVISGRQKYKNFKNFFKFSIPKSEIFQ